MSVSVIRAPLPEICPPRDMLLSYARGGRDPKVAGHISRCNQCAWLVTEAMEADTSVRDAEVIDITPPPSLWQRLLSVIRNLTRLCSR